MRDDYLDRSWADYHDHLSGDIHRAIHKFVRSFRVAMEHLNRQQFDAPWKRPVRRGKLVVR